MVLRVNGGIINDQTLTGGMRFFKIIAAADEFEWTVSDGTVNLPVFTTGGAVPVTTYFQVGDKRPVPESAAELVLREITKKCDVVIIGMDPGIYGDTAEIHIGVSASAFGWGSDVPAYDVPPANADEEQLPTSPTAAETQMAAAINAMPAATVYITTGGTDQTVPPVSKVVNFGGITVEEFSFSLGSLTYYTLA